MSDTSANDITVSLRYGDLDSAIDWCKENCSSQWDLAKIEEYSGSANGIYHFSFTDGCDAVLFSLRWL